MKIIEWANGKGQKLILTVSEADELKEALRKALLWGKREGECGRFEVEIE